MAPGRIIELGEWLTFFSAGGANLDRAIRNDTDIAAARIIVSPFDVSCDESLHAPSSSWLCVFV